MRKWPLSMDPVQEWGEEVEDGAVFGITLRREPVLPASPDPALDTTPPHEAPSVFTFAQYHTVKVRRMKAATLERLIDHLLDPEHQEADFTRVFLATYRAFTCPGTLIQLLFQRDDMMANLDNTTCSRSTLIPVIRLWLDEHAEDFRRPPQHQALRLLCAHLRHRLSFRRLATAADALFKRLKEDDRRAHPSSDSNHPRAEGKEEEEEGRRETASEEEPMDFMHFPKKDVAEQLTRLDAELFGRVEPFQCVGCVWSQRDKKDKGHLAPSVRATIAQFNAVTNSVIASLLLPSPSSHSPCPSSSPSSSPASGSPRSPPHHASPAHRARVIERWIAIAQECRQLRNFSSLRAVLSALQSNAVYRLKKTWVAVGRESMSAFDYLCETFPDENCTLTSREILVESYSSGVVPYLGTYLTVLTMLDTALPDTVEGGLINFEKRRREFEILSQIRQLQASSSQYSLPDRPHISAWLRGQRMLTDQESYDLSRSLEPPGDSCPSSPSAWSHRALTKKLTSLLTVSDGASRKSPNADQISVSSSGSSGSEMEDLTSPQPCPLRIKLKSFGSLQNVAEDFPPTSSPGRSASTSSSSSPAPSTKQLHLRHSSSTGAAPSPDPAPSPCCPAPSPQPCLPLYNRQVCDSCIVRVSVESGNNGNVYKSILLTSQDHTPQVVQRALEKHNLEGMSCQDFTLCQVLGHDKELQIPDNANVFYAMSTQANYDFILRQRWRSHGRRPFAPPSSSSTSSSSTSSSSSSPGALSRGRHGLAK